MTKPKKYTAKIKTHHVSNGMTHAEPYIYRCKKCNKRYTREQKENGFCEDSVSPEIPK